MSRASSSIVTRLALRPEFPRLPWFERPETWQSRGAAGPQFLDNLRDGAIQLICCVN
jgi:hypothetical protein